MAELDMSKSTTEDAVRADFRVDPLSLEVGGNIKESYFYFPNATEYQGYYANIPELQSALDSLGIYVGGKGYEVNDADRAILEGITGRGNENIIGILLNHFIMMKINGDAFAEIIRTGRGTLTNLMHIGAERMRVVENAKGIIIGYDIYEKQGWRRIKPENMFHRSNERIGDSGRGKSIIPAVKWAIDAMNEAMRDARLVYHRNVFPLRIIEYDGEDTSKRDSLMAQYATAIKNGDVLVIPKGVMEVKEVNVTIQDPIAWLNFLSNFFYQVVRIPRVIATGEGTTEVGGKMGYLSFEPFYIYEQQIYEADIWSQLGIRIKFPRPASLGGTVQSDEQKNTGQVGMQPNDVEASMTRE